ncbi:sporulation protein rmd1 [Basidiobolus ranarum]|uniref:Sporulation protein rmd1 n=1 Tax=Basidiobolus ranarum TaxID=34480 RepID=A0ABR2X1T2_9FUNG
MKRRNQLPASLPIQQKVVFHNVDGNDSNINGLESSLSRSKAKQPNRTTKTSQKLAIFPEEEQEAELLPGDLTEGDEVYNQIAQIPSGTARFEAEQLSKLRRKQLPRVSAHCTATSYRMDSLMKYLQTCRNNHYTAPKRFDEVLYTPFSFHSEKINQRNNIATGDLLLMENGEPTPQQSLFDTPVSEELNNVFLLGEVFFFDYGVIVMWGFSEEEEQQLLKQVAPFEVEKLDNDDVEVEELNFHYNPSCQPRIYNDIITLKHPKNYMVKLTISHAIAQSVKMTLFEELVDETINATKHIPQNMAQTGKVNMSRTAITQKIGLLFIMRINVNLVSNILDTPEIFWSEPAQQPLYNVMRGYLEISQRAELLNQRVSVIGDLLEMLKDHLNGTHGEKLEWIVILLIAFEIVIGLITIGFDIANYRGGAQKD